METYICKAGGNGGNSLTPIQKFKGKFGDSEPPGKSVTVGTFSTKG